MHTSIYHITHIENLPSILEMGGLIANSRLKEENKNYLDIAYAHIQDRRANIPVPCSVGGFLNDYIPFYFAPRSPMMYTINKGNVATYRGGQKSIIYLVSDTEVIEKMGLNFAFTDGHAVIGYSDFYDDIENLEDVIDWELMRSRYWANTLDDPDRKRRRQAEFLIHHFLPWDAVSEIGVINASSQSRTTDILQKFNLEKIVNIRYQWYY